MPGPRTAGAPAHSWKETGLPGFWADLLAARRDPRPRRLCRLLALFAAGGTAAFGHVDTFGSRDGYDFGTLTSAARTLAAYASPEWLTLSVARLASGSLGSALAGRDSHPKVGSSGFQDDIVSPLLPDQDFLVAPTFRTRGTVFTRLLPQLV